MSIPTQQPASTEYRPRWARRFAADLPAFGSGRRAAISLNYGLPDPALYPAKALAEATARVMADPQTAALALNYGNLQGQVPVREMLVEKLKQDEGLDLTVDNLLITNGALAAVRLAGLVFLDEGDTVLVEGPTFPGAVNVFRYMGANMVQMPVGESGLDVAGTETVLEGLLARGVHPRMLYTIPTFHNPTGLTLSEQSRRDLLSLARRYDLTIVEDDAYRDLYYDARRRPLPPSLYALDTDGLVVRTGTFSKILAPGMRLGWAIARPEVIRRMMLPKEEGGSNPFGQHVALEWGKNGVLAAHIADLVAAYRVKRDTMLDAMRRYFPHEARWTEPAGGFFVWVTLPPSVDQARLAELAREDGVDYMPGERCFAGERSTPGTYLRLSFTAPTLDEIEEAIKRLGRAMKSLL